MFAKGLEVVGGKFPALFPFTLFTSSLGGERKGFLKVLERDQRFGTTTLVCEVFPFLPKNF